MSKDRDTPVTNNHCGIKLIVLPGKLTLSPNKEVRGQNDVINIYVTIMRQTINVKRHNV